MKVRDILEYIQEEIDDGIIEPDTEVCIGEDVHRGSVLANYIVADDGYLVIGVER